MTYFSEDEASTKWCPMSRVLSHTSAQDGKGRLFEGGYSWNRAPNTFDRYDEDSPPYTPPAANCIGSKCMMWRARQGRMFVTLPGKKEELWSLSGWGTAEDVKKHNPGAEVRIEPQGECGLARA